MIHRNVRRRYRRNPASATLRGPGACHRDAICPETDAEAFECLVDARVRKLFGGPLDVVAPDPLLREVVRDAVIAGMRRPTRPVPPDVLELAARLREGGITLTPGRGDPRDFPKPLDLGWSLGDAIIEYRRAGH
jgi:hypothetical protein